MFYVLEYDINITKFLTFLRQTTEGKQTYSIGDDKFYGEK